MPLCPGCGDTVMDGSPCCSACGVAMENSIPCAHCGFPVPRETVRCVSCGRFLGGAPSVLAPGLRLQGNTGIVSIPSATASSPDSCLPGEEALPFARPRFRWSRRTDPYFITALLLAAASLAFLWAPRYNVLLAGASLIVSVLGYRRFFSYKHRGRYGGLWVNYVATAAGLCGLVAGAGLPAFFV